jgi:FdhD protein
VTSDLLDDAALSVVATKITGATADVPREDVSEQVVIERPITVAVYRVGEFTLMCTPVDLEALAVGFAYSEGMIDSLDDIIGIDRPKENPRVVARRNMIVASSCGLCGARTIERTLSDMPKLATTLYLSRDLLLQMTDKLWALQRVHPLTRGAHAAGIFTADGQIAAFAEDIGRHNALDKALGKCLLARHSTVGCGAVLSSRASFEMVAKAARAGIEIVVAAAAPSSLAIESASNWNLTLCASVRSGRANLYTHPQRIA